MEGTDIGNLIEIWIYIGIAVFIVAGLVGFIVSTRK